LKYCRFLKALLKPLILRVSGQIGTKIYQKIFLTSSYLLLCRNIGEVIHAAQSIRGLPFGHHLSLSQGLSMHPFCPFVLSCQSISAKDCSCPNINGCSSSNSLFSIRIGLDIFSPTTPASSSNLAQKDRNTVPTKRVSEQVRSSACRFWIAKVRNLSCRRNGT
jgi:hypothetical protein